MPWINLKFKYKLFCPVICCGQKDLRLSALSSPHHMEELSMQRLKSGKRRWPQTQWNSFLSLVVQVLSYSLGETSWSCSLFLPSPEPQGTQSWDLGDSPEEPTEVYCPKKPAHGLHEAAKFSPVAQTGLKGQDYHILACVIASSVFFQVTCFPRLNCHK